MRYEWKCHKCGHRWIECRPVAAANEKAACLACKSMSTSRQLPVFTINSGRGSRIPGVCHTLDKKPIYVRSKSHFRELCKQRDLTPVNL